MDKFYDTIFKGGSNRMVDVSNQLTQCGVRTREHETGAMLKGTYRQMAQEGDRV